MNDTQLQFEPISLDQQDKYLSHFASCPQKASDYSFVNLWAWADEYGLCWAWDNNLVWIKQTTPTVYYWAPVGRWEEIDWERSLDNYTGQIDFIRVPEKLLLIWKENLSSGIFVDETRGHWDYLYAVSELVELKGNCFHKKKNLLNQFRKKTDYTYFPFDKEMIKLAMKMQTDWCTWRDCESVESLSAENRAIEKVLKNWDNLLSVKGGALIVDHEMAAYTISEKLDEETLLIHFEKGDPTYRGVYQAINQMHLENSGKYFKLVNREQDLDDEGLRKAKLSYHPVDFLKKYQVKIKHQDMG